jgi:hypothetical protein
MMVIIIVTVQAHPLPLRRPQATTKLAIPKTIKIEPITPINAAKNRNEVLLLDKLIPVPLGVTGTLLSVVLDAVLTFN